jgi:hypothetical protein
LFFRSPVEAQTTVPRTCNQSGRIALSPSAIFSAIMMVGTFVLALGIVGICEASP